MATRFAVSTGNWSNTAIWDNGALPVAGDTVYPNGFTVTVDQDINVASLNNNISNVYLPNMPIPLMTGNTQPSGVAFGSSNAATFDFYKAFDYSNVSPNYWQSGTTNSGIIGYQFTAGKVIKRYYISSPGGTQYIPKTWTFEGSNDGTTYTTLDTIAANASANFVSSILANTTSYTYYRLNITAVQTAGNAPTVWTFEMTESTAATYGNTTGGSFTVPNTLSGSRTITQSGAGIVSNNANTVLTLAHNTGNTVNMNVSGSGYILNQNSQTVSAAFPIINVSGTGTTNFNGDIWGNQGLGFHNINGAIYINSAATINIIGNIYGGKGNVGTTYILIATPAASSTINITGNLIAANYSTLSYIIQGNNSVNINIIGNITSDISYCYYTTGAANLNVTGTTTITNANSAPAIYSTSTGLVTLRGAIINKSNISALLATRFRFNTATTPYWTVQDTTGTDFNLGYNTTGAYPAEADVRYGTTYGGSPTRTGTCRVPAPQYVSQGVLVDSTVGTAYLSATDVWNVLTSTITTAGSIGERLKNASTVQTTGDQLAAYQV